MKYDLKGHCRSHLVFFMLKYMWHIHLQPDFDKNQGEC